MSLLALMVVSSLSGSCETLRPLPPPSITWDWYNAAEIYKKTADNSHHDAELAAHYYLMAAKRGNTAAAYKIGEMYEAGLGVPKNYPTAFQWYAASTCTGSKYGEFKLGWFYQYGLGVPKSLEEARAWYEKAARQDNEWAYHMLAFMYADGDGVPKDTKRARQYFEISLPKTNDPWAKWKLALLIRKNDPERSRKLLAEAADQGNKQARQELRR